MVVTGCALIGRRAAFVASKHANGRLPAPVKGQHKDRSGVTRGENRLSLWGRARRIASYWPANQRVGAWGMLPSRTANLRTPKSGAKRTKGQLKLKSATESDTTQVRQFLSRCLAMGALASSTGRRRRRRTSRRALSMPWEAWAPDSTKRATLSLGSGIGGTVGGCPGFRKYSSTQFIEERLSDRVLRLARTPPTSADASLCRPATKSDGGRGLAGRRGSSSR